MESSPMEKNNSGKAFRLSLQTLVVGAILSLTFVLLFISAHKRYVSEVSILINTKSQETSLKHDQIISNIEQLPRMLSFYEKLLNNNPDIRDVFAGKNSDQRKKQWNETLEISRLEDSSVIKISVSSARQSDSEMLAQKVARTLFDTTGTYYNIKNDIDLRIIDGPITKTKVEKLYLILPLGIILGFVIAFLLNYFLDSGKKIVTRKKQKQFDFSKITRPSEKIQSLEDLYMPREEQLRPRMQETPENIPHDFANIQKQEKSEEMKKITKMLQPDRYPNYPEMPKAKKMSSAPDNLPVADESMFHAQEPDKADDKFVPLDEKSEEEQTREPTGEELKKRLNQLLKGGL